jgi:hypothetical protein
MPPAAVGQMFERMLTRYTNAQAALIAAGTPQPSDAQILAQMLAYMAPAWSYAADHTSPFIRE